MPVALPTLRRRRIRSSLLFLLSVGVSCLSAWLFADVDGIAAGIPSGTVVADSVRLRRDISRRHGRSWDGHGCVIPSALRCHLLLIRRSRSEVPISERTVFQHHEHELVC